MVRSVKEARKECYRRWGVTAPDGSQSCDFTGIDWGSARTPRYAVVQIKPRGWFVLGAGNSWDAAFVEAAAYKAAEWAEVQASVEAAMRMHTHETPPGSSMAGVAADAIILDDPPNPATVARYVQARAKWRAENPDQVDEP